MFAGNEPTMKTCLPLVATIVVLLSGCDQLGIAPQETASDTNMRSVEIQAGTASDEMIILDQASGDGTAIDASTAAGPAAPRPDGEANDGDGTTTSGDDAGGAAEGDQVIRPPVGGAEADGASDQAAN